MWALKTTSDMTTMVMGVGLLITIGCAMLAGNIAEKKGYSFAAFAVFGVFLSVIALIVAAVLPDKNTQPQLMASESAKAQAIADYKKLLDDGTITQEEFDAKKHELLS